MKKAFHESVDDYLEFCKKLGETLDRPFSGQFVTRISPDLHRRVNVAALLSGKSLNGWVAEQLQAAVLRVAAMKTAAVGKKRAARTAKRKRKVLVRKVVSRMAK